MRYPSPITNPLLATEAEIQDYTYRRGHQYGWNDFFRRCRIDMESDLEVSLSVETEVEDMIEDMWEDGH